MNPNIQKAIHQIDTWRSEHGNPYWNISYETGIFLNTLARVKQATSILEIGTSIGYSALFFADAAVAHTGHVYTVESHAERFEEAKKNLEQAGITHTVTQIKGHAPEILSEVHETFDLIFLDATKMEYLSYIQALEQKLNPGGLLIADNVESHKGDLENFLTYMQEHPKFQTSIVPIGTGLLIGLYLP